MPNRTARSKPLSAATTTPTRSRYGATSARGGPALPSSNNPVDDRRDAIAALYRTAVAPPTGQAFHAPAWRTAAA